MIKLWGRAVIAIFLAAAACNTAAAEVINGPDRASSHKAASNKRAEAQVPEAAGENLRILVDLGIVELPAGVDSAFDPTLTRQDMAIMTIKAMDALGEDAAEKDQENFELFKGKQGGEQVLALKKEFTKELQNLGMNTYRLTTTTKASSEADSQKLAEDLKYKFSGELRYSYVQHTGAERFRWNDSRIRARLFLEAKLNEDWHAFGMVEGNHHFLSQYGENSWLKDSRFYVRGLTGETIVTAGWYGYLLGDGNIYDSSIFGATANWGEPVNYEVTVGKTNDDASLVAATAVYKDVKNNAEYGGGLQKFGDDKYSSGERFIWNGYANYMRDKWTLGAMYLGSDKKDEEGNSNGYVLMAKYGILKSWIPGTDEFTLRYYNQPRGTYVAHTMTGLAGYMNGFKGLGATYYRTIVPNVLWGVEYYDLKEKITGDNGRTLWSQVSCYF